MVPTSRPLSYRPGVLFKGRHPAFRRVVLICRDSGADPLEGRRQLAHCRTGSHAPGSQARRDSRCRPDASRPTGPARCTGRSDAHRVPRSERDTVSPDRLGWNAENSKQAPPFFFRVNSDACRRNDAARRLRRSEGIRATALAARLVVNNSENATYSPPATVSHSAQPRS